MAYGTLHIRHAIDADPDVAEEVHEALDHGEKAMVALGRAADMSTAIALLLAGGADRVEDVGFPLQRRLSRNQFTSYLARCERAGISRLERTKLDLDELGLDLDEVKAASGR